jgi:hypothetical protein
MTYHIYFGTLTDKYPSVTIWLVSPTKLLGDLNICLLQYVASSGVNSLYLLLCVFMVFLVEQDRWYRIGVAIPYSGLRSLPRSSMIYSPSTNISGVDVMLSAHLRFRSGPALEVGRNPVKTIPS